MINPDNVTAIDVHVHAEVSCTDPEDPVMGKFFDASTSYFKGQDLYRRPEHARKSAAKS